MAPPSLPPHRPHWGSGEQLLQHQTRLVCPPASGMTLEVLLGEGLLFLLAALLACQQWRRGGGRLGARQSSQRLSQPQTARETRKEVEQPGANTRNLFVAFLFASCFARCLSLLCLGYLDSQIFVSSSSASPSASPCINAEWLLWLIYLMKLLPSLLFLATYSIIALFWAQVFFAATLVAKPNLSLMAGLLNGLVFGLLIVIGVATYVAHSFTSFLLYSSALIGAAYAATAVAFAYYGIKVAGQLSERSKLRERTRSVIRRVFFLAVSCPFVFALRAAYSTAFVLEVAMHAHTVETRAAGWDNVVWLVCEWVPSVIILITFWGKGSSKQSLSRRSPMDQGGMSGLRSPLVPASASSSAAAAEEVGGGGGASLVRLFLACPGVEQRGVL
eukprot:GHVT01061585.1.p1 GENE.GHVT01061585.1~~GHVT01061585.1.p1  ORF type:complete len:388 (-),score=77.18 GHVT01061585.1:612-1775(-)